MIYKRFGKRVMDIVLSLCAIIVFSPFLTVIAILVRIKIGKPVLFCQVRPGKNGRLFRMYKFRTMTDKRDTRGELLPDSERLLPFGRLLRETSLDELPELFNIIKGDMSIVGPRPLLVKDMVFMNEQQKRRYEVPQGLTGLAQVRGRNAITWEYKLESDVEYVEHYSFLSDVKILLQTVGMVLRREGINEEKTATAVDFGDHLLEENKIDEIIYKKKVQDAQKIVTGYPKR